MGWNHNTIRLANKKDVPVYRMDYSGNNLVAKYLNQLYDGASVYLNRKYIKYIDCKNRSGK